MSSYYNSEKKSQGVHKRKKYDSSMGKNGVKPFLRNFSHFKDQRGTGNHGKRTTGNQKGDVS
jgi:hypothetical protein